MDDRIKIDPLRQSLADAIVQTNGGAAWNGGAEKWDGYLREHIEGKRLTLVVHVDGRPVGYGSLIFQPKYTPFSSMSIPEISDLVVAETARSKGIASQLMAQLESEAQQRNYPTIGLGVGLYGDYGSAQRLYARLGYVMDGRGITASNEPVVPGSMVKVDDDLLIWLTKSLPSIASAKPD